MIKTNHLDMYLDMYMKLFYLCTGMKRTNVYLFMFFMNIWEA